MAPFFVRTIVLTTLLLTASSCRRSGEPDESTLAVGVLGGPEQEVLDFVSAQNPKLGLRVVRYEDAERLRAAVKQREIAAASFETLIALEQTNPDPELGSAGTTVTLPLGFYSKRIKTLEQLAVGAVVALPSEGEPQSRAIHVLINAGLLSLPQELERALRLGDVQNPHRLDLRELPSNGLPRALEDAALVALDFGAAARLGLAPARHAIIREDGFTPFAQVLTARRSDLAATPAWLAELLAAYRAPAVKTFILEHFEDSVRRPW